MAITFIYCTLHIFLGKKMVNGNLQKYVRQLLQQGYSPESIKRTLVSSGHSPKTVDEVLSQRAVKVKPVLIIAGIIGILVISIMAYFFVFPETKLISLQLTTQTKEVQTGGTLKFTSILKSPQEKEAQVILTYEIIDQKKKQIVLTEKEEAIVGESAQLLKNIDLPTSISSGTYMLRTIVQYDNNKDVKTALFSVKSSEKTKEILPNESKELVFEEAEYTCPLGCEDYNPCTNDKCDKGVCKHNTITPCCGNGKCESGETILNCAEDCSPKTKDSAKTQDEALIAGKTDIQRATVLCNSIPDPGDSDKCFSDLAKVSNKSTVCGGIQNIVSRDGCYIDFAYQEDFTVCDQVNDEYLLRTCYTLSALNEQAPAA